ncbi:MAG: hypothetical protein LBQ70_05150 [Prevotellaceae bacterium]|jgi:hypothetical protein|nr:hypothetical protein [Prevotellaceae bacterium]
MAKQKGNVVTHGLSGKIGDLLVFRQVDGKTVVSKIPEQSKTVSENQKKTRKRFQQAAIYAKAATAKSSESKEIYDAAAKKKKSIPYRVAVADFFNAPDIHHVDVSHYTGAPGDVIRIEVSDDTAVKSVKVTIINADGSLVEEGDAQVDVSGYVWKYTAVQTNDSLEGDKIVITASDFPENITREEQILE